MKFFKCLLLLLAISSSSWAISPYLPDCPGLDPKIMAELELITNQRLRIMEKRPDDRLITRILNNRKKFLFDINICNQIEELFPSKDIRVKNLKNGKAMILSDTDTSYKIIMDVLGQYYRITSLEAGRAGDQFVDVNLLHRGRRNKYDFEDLSHFDYSQQTKKTYIEQGYLNQISDETRARVKKYHCDVYFNPGFKRKK